MALDQSALTELLDAPRSGGDDVDFMREAMQLVLQALIDLDATQVIGTVSDLVLVLANAPGSAPPLQRDDRLERRVDSHRHLEGHRHAGQTTLWNC